MPGQSCKLLLEVLDMTQDQAAQHEAITGFLWLLGDDRKFAVIRVEW